jgi:hypothetical protein
VVLHRPVYPHQQLAGQQVEIRALHAHALEERDRLARAVSQLSCGNLAVALWRE